MNPCSSIILASILACHAETLTMSMWATARHTALPLLPALPAQHTSSERAHGLLARPVGKLMIWQSIASMLCCSTQTRPKQRHVPQMLHDCGQRVRQPGFTASLLRCLWQAGCQMRRACIKWPAVCANTEEVAICGGRRKKPLTLTMSDSSSSSEHTLAEAVAGLYPPRPAGCNTGWEADHTLAGYCARHLGFPQLQA